jgi:hypothetical protein
MDAFTQFLEDYYYLWGAGLIIMGIFLAFFGNKFVSLVLFLTVTVGAFLILGSIFFYAFLSKVKPDWGKWLSVAAIGLVSAGLGFLVMRLRKWGVALLAAWGGVLLGFVITTAFMIKEEWAFYLTLAGCALVAFFIGYKVETAVIIMVTSFVGSYGLVRGISLYAGHFPSESQLHDEIRSGAVDWKSFDKIFYIYLGAIVILSLVTGFYQWRQEKSLRSSLHQLKRPIK